MNIFLVLEELLKQLFEKCLKKFLEKLKFLTYFLGDFLKKTSKDFLKHTLEKFLKNFLSIFETLPRSFFFSRIYGGISESTIATSIGNHDSVLKEIMRRFIKGKLKQICEEVARGLFKWITGDFNKHPWKNYWNFLKTLLWIH